MATIPELRREDPDDAALRRGGVLDPEEVLGCELDELEAEVLGSPLKVAQTLHGIRSDLDPPLGDGASQPLEEGDELIGGRRHTHLVCSCCVFRQAPRGGSGDSEPQFPVAHAKTASNASIAAESHHPETRRAVR